MKQIYSEHKERKIKETEDIKFNTEEKGLYLIQISAKTKGKKQIGGTDDEDLRIEINHRKFPQLKNASRYLDSPAAFSGGTSKGLTKTIYFLIWLETGPHIINLIPDIGATLTEIKISQVSKKHHFGKLVLDINKQAEDGDRRDWITFILTNASLNTFTPQLTLQRRFLDNIAGAFIYFNWLYQRYDGQIKKTLAAWNWGPGNVLPNKHFDFKSFPTETQNLINDVLGDHDF